MKRKRPQGPAAEAGATSRRVADQFPMVPSFHQAWERNWMSVEEFQGTEFFGAGHARNQGHRCFLAGDGRTVGLWATLGGMVKKIL